MKSNKEDATMMVSKEFLASIDLATDYIKFLSKEMSRALAEKLRAILENNGEVIVKMTDLGSFNVPETNSIQYKKRIKWSKLVRCRDCRHQMTAIIARYKDGTEEWRQWCTLHPRSYLGGDDDFCSKGEKKGTGNES